MTKQKEVGAWYWHIHHGVLAERADEPIKNRVKYIKEEKSKDEVALRLKLLKRVKNQKVLNDAREAHDKAVATAWEAYGKAVAPAREAYEKAVAPAREAYEKAVADLHAKECPDCPWDGKTIFPEKKEE